MHRGSSLFSEKNELCSQNRWHIVDVVAFHNLRCNPAVPFPFADVSPTICCWKRNTCIAVATLSSSVVFSALCSGCAFLNSVTFIDSYRNELCEMENSKSILPEFLFRTKNTIILQNVKTRRDEISLISSENVWKSFRKIEWVTKGAEIWSERQWDGKNTCSTEIRGSFGIAFNGMRI